MSIKNKFYLKGECFDFFVPATDRGNELTETFIIDGVGHDLYPRSWERLENSVKLDDMALEYMDKALEIYRSMIFEDKLYRVRSEADCIHDCLSKAVAFLNHTYTESPIYSENQAYNRDAESRLYFCPEMKIVPDGFFANGRKLLEVQKVDEVKETVFALLKTTRAFILERKPAAGGGAAVGLAGGGQIDYQGLAEWYQEMSLTWRRLRYFCANNIVEKAYIDACYLQEEFMYIAQDYKIDELNLLDSFDKDNLSLLADRSNQLEKIIQGILTDHQIKINSYDSIEDFLSKRG